METAVLTQVEELAEAIKETGRRSAEELPPLLKKAEELAREQTADPFTRALAHRAAGNAQQLMNRFEDALANYDAAIAILERTKEAEQLGRTLHAKVGLLFFLSRFDDLLACAERARALFEQLGDRRRLARLDVNLSHAYHRLDRFDLVLECAERALPILRQTGDREGLLAAEMNAAVALTVMHRFEEAEQRYLEALGLASELGFSSWKLHCAYNLAYLRYLSGDASQALGEIQTLRAHYAEAGEERHVCLCFLDEAEILLEIGDLDDAIRAAESARALGEKLRLNFEVGKSLLFEAAGRLRRGDESHAESLLEEAAARFQTEHNGVWTAAAKLQTALFHGEQGNPRSLHEALSARRLLVSSELPHRLALADIVIGRLQRGQGRLEDSIESLRSAAETARRSRSEWMQYHAAYELGVSLSHKGSRESLDCFLSAERLLDSLWDRLGSDDLKFAFLTDRENVYSYLVAQMLEFGDRDQFPARGVTVKPDGSVPRRKLVSVPKFQKAAFEFSEKARSRVLRERLGVERAGLTGVQSRLATDETLLEYFVNGPDVVIFALTTDGLHCVVRCGAAARILENQQSLDRHLASCSVKWERLEAVHRQLHETAAARLEALHQELIAPVASMLRNRVVIVPHGFLHGTPFHALSNGGRGLMDEREIAYSPSAALYVGSPQSEPPPALPRRERVEAPVFIAFTGRQATSSVQEVEEAAARMPRAVVLINPSAAALRETFEVPRPIVHIAGHAGIDAIGGTLSWIETPEGRLTGRDLDGMSIRAKTVVITGCRTARRAILPGDEWQGLMRAFYLSGAAAIVSAFWDIRDESALRFASEFYRRFDGNNAPAAVRAACGAVREWRGHPYFWGGFGAFVRKHREF